MKKRGILFLLILCAKAHGLNVYVSPEGREDANGTEEAPLTFGAAVRQVEKYFQDHDMPKEGISVLVKPGLYHFEEPCVLGAGFSGTKEQPIKIQATGDGEVIFTGSRALDTQEFTRVTEPDERARLSVSAVDKVIAMTVQDAALIKRFNQKLMSNLSINGIPYRPSVFPNQGYAQLQSETVVAEDSPPGVPVGKQAYAVRGGYPPYQVEGKEIGWRGSLETPHGAQARIGEKSEEMAGSWQQWENELKRNNRRNTLTGFIEANWLLSSQPIFAANAETSSVHLSKALAYGWAWKNNDKPFRVFGLLCELDSPGEWHFDSLTNRLYIYPPDLKGEDLEVSLPLASGFLTFDGSSYVSVHGLSVKDVARGSVYFIKDGNHNVISGCTISNSTAIGVYIEGQHNSVKGCDLYDLNAHVVLRGGVRSPKEITPGNNLVENCHIYQKNVKHVKVNVFVSGVGNTFSHNLVHNSLGQAINISGNDHVLQLNEVFNVGYDEGDGGAMYAGGDITGYGVVYKHNFFHHLMHVPGKVPRSGIHLDDLQAGATCIGNIFFKSAEKGIHMNGGAGHTLRDNVFLEGSMGAYNNANGGKVHYRRQLSALNDKDSIYRKTKENYVGRAEKVVGKRGWEKAPWRTKYPLFTKIMREDKEFGRMWPIYCVAENNFYYKNTTFNRSVWKKMPKEALDKLAIKNDQKISPEDFANYDMLDLRFSTKGIVSIPFETIGLKLDGHRNQMPDKNHYRKVIKDFFKDELSMPGTFKRIDTAEVIEKGPKIRR